MLTDIDREALLEWARLLESDEFIQIKGHFRNSEGHCAVGVARFLRDDLHERLTWPALRRTRTWIMRQNDTGMTFPEIAGALREMAARDEAPWIQPSDRRGDEPLCGACV